MKDYITKTAAPSSEASIREDDRLLTVSEVAAFLHWSRGTVYHKISRRELPGIVHLSRRSVRVWKSALVRWANKLTDSNPV